MWRGDLSRRTLAFDAKADAGSAADAGHSCNLRQALLAMFRSAQWLCRFTFRGNEYQEILELDLRYMQPCLLTAGTFDPDPLLLQRTVPHCHLNSGCPVVPLKAVQVDRHLGLLSFAAIQANSIRALVALNAVELPDDETLQQEPATTSAMRVKRSVDCLLSGLANDSDVPFRVKLRCAGPASAVNWILRGQAGQVFQVVLGQADSPGEWSVLWHVSPSSRRSTWTLGDPTGSTSAAWNARRAPAP